MQTHQKKSPHIMTQRPTFIGKHRKKTVQLYCLVTSYKLKTKEHSKTKCMQSGVSLQGKNQDGSGKASARNRKKRGFYRGTHHWEELGLICYEARHTYCAMRGDDLSDDPLSWKATTKLMKMGNLKKTVHSIIHLIFKLTLEMFDMG